MAKELERPRAYRASGSQAKLFLDAELQRAENSGARETRIADRMIDERTDARQTLRVPR